MLTDSDPFVIINKYDLKKTIPVTGFFFIKVRDEYPPGKSGHAPFGRSFDLHTCFLLVVVSIPKDFMI